MTNPKPPTVADLNAGVDISMNITNADYKFAKGGRLGGPTHVGVDLVEGSAPVYAMVDNGRVYVQPDKAHRPLSNAAIVDYLAALRQLNQPRLFKDWSFSNELNLYMGGATRELKRRLNDRLQGKDPGQPVNWPGLERVLEQQQRKDWP